LHYRKSFYRRPPPPLRGLAAPRDPPLVEGARLELDELEEELLELVRLCTTEGLIRTGCDLLAEGLPAEVVCEDPLLLPLNLCHPPLLACEAVDPVAAEAGRPGLMADVLPDDEEEGLTRCQPPVAPLLALRADELAGLAADERVADAGLADRVIACLCWSKDTWFAELVADDPRLE
jgi:hypothetical protein